MTILAKRDTSALETLSMLSTNQWYLWYLHSSELLLICISRIPWLTANADIFLTRHWWIKIIIISKSYIGSNVRAVEFGTNVFKPTTRCIHGIIYACCHRSSEALIPCRRVMRAARRV